jgi:hypothetical protein
MPGLGPKDVTGGAISNAVGHDVEAIGDSAIASVAEHWSRLGLSVAAKMDPCRLDPRRARCRRRRRYGVLSSEA